ncbi:MAG: GGDEF domain-containing protein [Clostridia bacterium]|nr:GGDEF domain-containing protein [Clostridia bacterium]
MENNILIDKYRERLLKLHAATVAIVSIGEIFAYYVFIFFGLERFAPDCGYLWSGVLIPICINVAVHIAARKKCRNKEVDVKHKNNAVIYAAIVTTFVVSVFHRDYIVTSCAFVFPIILSAMFNDRKLLRKCMLYCLLTLSVTATILLFEWKMDLTMLINILVLYGFVAVSYLSADLSIKFSQSNFSLIQEQADANIKLETILDLDPMTQLFNHEAFYEKLGMAIEEAKSGKKNLSVAMIDIDDFKSVNDTYGHDAGDDVLVALAGILQNCCGEGDFACRYGGEEFGLIFCGKTVDEAGGVISKALKNFSAHKFDFTQNPYTFSCGIAGFVSGDTIETIFDRADGYLYTSKKSGKNQITMQSANI